MKLYGKNPVIERIKQNPETIRKIYIEERHPDGSYVRRKAQKWKILVLTVPKSKIQKIARNLNAQGIVAEVAGFEYTDYAELLDKALNKKWSLLFLDGLNDPQNLGTIIRSLGCLGHFAIVLPKSGSVSVTESVTRIACGGENYVAIAQVSNLVNAIKKAKEAGYWIAGTSVGEGESIFDVQFNFPIGFVIGSEQKGIRPITVKHIDTLVTIPMLNQRMSFNAAHAATLVCYEIIRQKNINK